MEEKITAYLSLGSNQGYRPFVLQQAILDLNTTVGQVTQVSQVYENPAMGFEGPDFLNLCVAVNTFLNPSELLQALLDLEKRLGRTRKNTNNYESRPLDIDIIYYGDAVIDNETLTLPHPRMQERRFVLKPLADIAPQFYHPLFKKDTRNLLQECPDKSTLDKKGKLFKNRQALFSQLHFLAIEGNIGAGKTTLTKKIAADFNAKLVLERFADNPFLPKFYDDPSRYAFPLEMSFLADRYQQFTDDTSQFDLFKTFMISDYDIYKSLIFADVTLQEVEFDLYRKLFNFMYKEVKKPDIYVYLYQNTERLLQNIKKRGRDYEQEIKADYLENINQGYLNFIKGYPEQNHLIINLEELDFVESEKDYERILTKIGKKILERIF